MQKKIEIPCIFGDRSNILRSLENESGNIKLPLYILEAKGINSDPIRNADLHVDVFYQPDISFSKLDPSNKLYRPYNLNKRRGLPITIDYDLTLVTRYREDLDQMCTNWMVHWRPDIYVRWWHPRNKTAPLESEILWKQNISFESNMDYDPTKRFQWVANTSFTFKTWVFPGLNDVGDTNGDLDQDLILYFNYYPLVGYENYDSTSGVILPEEGGNTGYPVFGDIYNRDDAGFFAVDSDQEFENDGSDPEGILKGHYAVNNIKSDPESILYDPVSGVLLSGQTMIPDITTVGDMPTNIALLASFPKFEIWQDYCIQDPISNEQMGFKYVYFKNGYPISASTQDPPSGDLLFDHFYSTLNRFANPPEDFSYNNPIVSGEFGTTYTDPLQPQYQYDVETKQLTIFGQSDEDKPYVSYICSEINSTSGITQIISLRNKRDDYPISMRWERTIDQNINYLPDKDINELVNVNVWHHPKDKSQSEFVKFNIEFDIYRNKLIELKNQIETNWDDLNIELINETLNTYELSCTGNKLNKLKTTLNINLDNFLTFQEKQTIEKDGIEYNVLVNDYLYFILTDNEEIEDGIYDWGIIAMPHFYVYRNPIFNITLDNCNTVFGISIDTNLSFH